ncbi:hypothetical protein CN221_16130 [Sinorhizobium meliloti]|uniref:hypothetical protein n=1 Tax=Rhizobium meliloti TaxID=382 RepID=UPI000FE06E5C|nr:hypothetical protein [Sinorhizobium meliloti]MDX0617374.1 hypothetical protein [Sinorhizobium medicae]MDX0765594.1 hypothetical protein [Sinorhizobium medicae]MDX0827071.1 hypothetical protein [Sinorhizobium medicae]RVG94220.1 hypothetical protein CN221_16130 [Sinorhizobium meliloti]RVH67253.1 hypothetical protein CN209_08130 [Sinorhizobium meliloti]
MKSRTDEMNDEEFLEYLIRAQWKDRALQAGSGLLAGSCVAYVLAFPVVACALLSAVGICLLLIAAYLHLTEPAFVPLAIEEELTEEERVRRVFLSDLEIM